MADRSRYARNYSNLDKLNKYIFEEFEVICRISARQGTPIPYPDVRPLALT